MTKKNNSAGKPYYSQRNNKIKPGTSCNVTSMISALSAAGWPVERLAPKGTQPEDALMRFLLTDPTSQAQWKRLDPSGAYPPNEWHTVLADGTNRLVRSIIGGGPLSEGFKAITFTENASAALIAEYIRSGGAAAVSGLFPLPDGRKLNHVVSVVGVVGDDDPEAFILDDPWGDYHDGYANQRGDDIQMSMDDFLSIVKFPSSPRKMSHLVRAYT